MRSRPSYAAVADPDGTRTLRAWLDYMPQELYNTVHDLTFTLDEGVPIALDETYKLPSILQVSWAIRASLLPIYFGGRFYGKLDRVFDWVSSLSLNNQALLRDNSLVCFIDAEYLDFACTKQEVKWAFAEHTERSLNRYFHAGLSSVWSNASLGLYVVCISETEMMKELDEHYG